MLLLYGLLYFGFATLGRQRQDKATAYAAWSGTQQGGAQQASPLFNQFWLWNGSGYGSSVPGSTASAPPNSSPSAAAAGDTNFCIYGDSLTTTPPNTNPWNRYGDEYYGMEKLVSPEGVVQWLPYGAPGYNAEWNNSDDINGNTVVYIPCQLEDGHLAGWPFGNYFFDSERVAVDLWNYAQGTTVEYFTLQSNEPQFKSLPTSFSSYLNSLSGDWIDTPTQTFTEPSASPGWGWGVGTALNGPPGGQPWLQRVAVESTMTYNPPFLGQIYQDPNAPPSSTFGQYVSGTYSEPPQSLTTATTDCDVTQRTSGVLRLGAEESGPPTSQTSDAFLSQVSDLFDFPLLVPPDADNLDGQILALPTVNGSWAPTP